MKVKNDTACPFSATVDVIGGKWKPHILYFLLDDTRRFSELKRAMPGITQQMLTQQLRQLEKDGIVQRKVYPVVPPKVEYSLTNAGRNLKPVIKMMEKWGREFLLKE